MVTVTQALILVTAVATTLVGGQGQDGEDISYDGDYGAYPDNFYGDYGSISIFMRRG